MQIINICRVNYNENNTFQNKNNSKCFRYFELILNLIMPLKCESLMKNKIELELPSLPLVASKQTKNPFVQKKQLISNAE